MTRLWLLALVPALPAAPAVAEDPVQNVFELWDANGDGILQRSEAPDEGVFDRADANKDGKLTREEVAAFLGVKIQPKPKAEPEKKKSAKKPPKKTPPKKRPDAAAKKKESKSEATPERRPVTIPERVRDFLKRFDLNKDQKIQKKEFRGGEEDFKKYDGNKNNVWSRGELTRYIRVTLENARRNPTPLNFMDLFDRNRDGKVTRKEYNGPGQFWRNYDHDRNNIITPQELTMVPSMTGGRREIVDPDGPTRLPKRTLLDRYDANGDRKITLEELGGAAMVLRRLDLNGDGVLTGREVR